MRTLETPQWQVTAYYSFLLADWARFVVLRAPGDILFMIRIDIRTNLSIFSRRAFAYLLNQMMLSRAWRR